MMINKMWFFFWFSIFSLSLNKQIFFGFRFSLSLSLSHSKLHVGAVVAAALRSTRPGDERQLGEPFWSLRDTTGGCDHSVEVVPHHVTLSDIRDRGGVSVEGEDGLQCGTGDPLALVEGGEVDEGVGL